VVIKIQGKKSILGRKGKETENKEQKISKGCLQLVHFFKTGKAILEKYLE